jgi:hypothetical protein
MCTTAGIAAKSRSGRSMAEEVDFLVVIPPEWTGFSPHGRNLAGKGPPQPVEGRS